MAAHVPRRKDVPRAVRLFVSAPRALASAARRIGSAGSARMYPELGYFSPRCGPNGRTFALPEDVSGRETSFRAPFRRGATPWNPRACRDSGEMSPRRETFPRNAPARSSGGRPAVTAGSRPQSGRPPQRAPPLRRRDRQHAGCSLSSRHAGFVRFGLTLSRGPLSRVSGAPVRRETARAPSALAFSRGAGSVPRRTAPATARNWAALFVK